jgi:hypothetical protein
MEIKQFGFAVMLAALMGASVGADLRHVEMKTLGMD